MNRYIFSHTLCLFLRQFLAWLILFKAGHLVFLLYHFEQSTQYSLLTWLKALLTATRLDLSMTGYIMIIPGILYAFSFIYARGISKILRYYHASILLIYALCLSIDLGLFSEWGFRLDLTPLQYTNNLGAMAASVTITETLWHLLLAGVFFFSGYLLLKKLLLPISVYFDGRSWKKTLFAFLFFLSLSILIIPIRGSFGKSTINQSTVYFHESSFINQSCVNVLWNIIYSAVYWDNHHAQYHFMEKEKATQVVDQLNRNFHYAQELFITERPNIVLIILEGFGHQTSPLLGGNDTIAPNLNRLKKEGVFFSHCYASGDRTNMAIPALLAAHPALPNQPILNSPRKVNTLPTIAEKLNQHNYHTGFYYGGEIDFAQINALVRSAAFNTVVCKDEVRSRVLSSWGVPDHLMFQLLFEEIDDRSIKPFFKVLLTLSSHRPYDIPMEPVFFEDNPWTPYNNSVFYTDKHLGHFITQARETSWWDSTVIILVGDHGITINNTPRHHVPEKFKVPMLWLGGALAIQDTIITTTCSQTDIAASLLENMNISHNFSFSNNVFYPDFEGFAFYSYNNGFGFATDENYIAYCLLRNETTLFKGAPYEDLEKKGKAYLQVITEDFNER